MRLILEGGQWRRENKTTREGQVGCRLEYVGLELWAVSVLSASPNNDLWPFSSVPGSFINTLMKFGRSVHHPLPRGDLKVYEALGFR